MEKELWKGNEAIAEAAIRAGCDCFFGYPITPQSEVPEYMSAHLPKAGGVFLQSESEVAAINMVYGAAGRRHAGHDLFLLPRHQPETGGHYIHRPAPSCPASSSTACAAVRAWAPFSPARAITIRPPAAAATAITGRWSSPPPMCRRRWTSSRRHLTLPTSTATPSWWLWDGLIGQMMEPIEWRLVPKRDLPPKDWATTGP